MWRNKDKMNETDAHHLNSYSSGGTEHSDNMIDLNRWEHEAYHRLFGWLWIIEALRKLFSRWEKSFEDGKTKDQLRDALNDIDYKSTCKGGSKKKRR